MRDQTGSDGFTRVHRAWVYRVLTTVPANSHATHATPLLAIQAPGSPMVAVYPGDVSDTAMIPGLIIEVNAGMHYSPTVGFLRHLLQQQGAGLLSSAMRDFSIELPKMLKRQKGYHYV